MNNQSFQFILHMIPNNQITPQGQLLFLGCHYRLNGKERWKVVKFWILIKNMRQGKTQKQQQQHNKVRISIQQKVRTTKGAFQFLASKSAMICNGKYFGIEPAGMPVLGFDHCR